MLAVVAVIGSAAEVRGRILLTPYATYVSCAVLWILVFFEWILDASAFNQSMCQGTSLKQIGFSYGAGWALCFVAWLLISIAVIIYYVRRRRHPPPTQRDGMVRMA